MRSWFFGKKRVSVPFAPYGGVCADDRAIGTAHVEETKRITEDRLDAGGTIVISKDEKLGTRVETLMRSYLYVCCRNRPFEDQVQDRG